MLSQQLSQQLVGLAGDLHGHLRNETFTLCEGMGSYTTHRQAFFLALAQCYWRWHRHFDATNVATWCGISNGKHRSLFTNMMCILKNESLTSNDTRFTPRFECMGSRVNSLLEFSVCCLRNSCEESLGRLER